MTTTEEHTSAPEQEANPELERRAQRRESWRGFFHAAPAYVYLVFFFVMPLLVVRPPRRDACLSLDFLLASCRESEAHGGLHAPVADRDFAPHGPVAPSMGQHMNGRVRARPQPAAQREAVAEVMVVHPGEGERVAVEREMFPEGPVAAPGERLERRPRRGRSRVQ